MKLLYSMVWVMFFGMVAMGVGLAGQISYGDAKKMANSYPPGGNPRLFANWPAVDIRPFASDPNDPDSFGYDKNLYCEDDWHVLAIAEFAHVYRSLDRACDQDCVNACYSCINEATGGLVIPFATQKEAANWLKGLDLEFRLDDTSVEVTRTAVKAYVDHGAFWINPDGTVGGYGESFGLYLRDVACAEECSSGFGMQIYGVQWSRLLPPVDEDSLTEDPLPEGQHDFRVTLPNGFFLEVTITVSSTAAPECAE